MDDASIFDTTANSRLTIFGNVATSATQTKYADTSIYFDGTGDYIRFFNPNLILNNKTWTIEAWVYRTGTQNMQMLFGTMPPHTTLGISLNRTGSGNTYIYVGNGSSWVGAPAINTGTNTPITVNTWHHIALVCNGTNITLYHDGTNVGTSTTLPSGMTGWGIIGAYEFNGSFGEYYTGYVENFQILNGIAKYTTNFTPPTNTQNLQNQLTS